MDENLKELMQELGNAINESLSDSERIAAAIGDIKSAGYDVFLVLEATIGFKSARKKFAFGIGKAGTSPSEGIIYEKLRTLEAKGGIKIVGS